jgi:Mrp family chromosome partitioning ATPase/capsular polysaccharide biosynthesis protein
VYEDRRTGARLDESWQTDEGLADGPGIIASVWRHRFVVAAVALLLGCGGYVLSLQSPPRYKAEASLILKTPGSSPIFRGDSGQPVDLESYMARQATIVGSSPVLARAQQRLHQHQPLADFRSAITVQPSKNLASIIIDATAADAGSASDTANAVGSAYQEIMTRRTAQEARQAIDTIEEVKRGLQAKLDTIRQPDSGQPDSERDALVAQISALSQRQWELATQAAVFGSGVELFERADRPGAPDQPKPILGALLGAVVGLVGAGAWAWWAAARNHTAQDRDDPGAVLRVPLLGEVPHFRSPRPASNVSIASPSALGPVVTEAYHHIVASLELARASLSGSSVMLTSATPGEGKTVTALNVAIAAQQEDSRVALVDADIRVQRLSELCGQRGGWGLTDVGDEPVELTNYLYCLDLEDDSVVLPVLPAGTEVEHPAGFFRSSRFRKALLSVGERTDIVLIDSPALLAVSDAIAIAGQVDGIVIVVSRGTPLRHLRALRDSLARVDTPVIGYVFNRSSAFPHAYEYGLGDGGRRRVLRLPGWRRSGKRTGTG